MVTLVMISQEKFREVVRSVGNTEWAYDPITIQNSTVTEKYAIDFSEHLITTYRISMDWRMKHLPGHEDSAKEYLAKKAFLFFYGDIIYTLSELRYDAIYMSKDEIYEALSGIVAKITDGELK